MKQAQSTLRETSVYDSFIYNNEQRPIDARHVKDIAESMSVFGFLPSKPVQCYQEGKKFVIIDGHHRYVAAKNLQIPVIFVVEAKTHSDSMATVNGLQKSWNIKNYLNQYLNRGIRAYIELSEYHQLGFPIMQAARMLGGFSAFGGQSLKDQTGKSIRDGSFKIKTREKIEIIASFLRKNADANKAFKTHNFIAAFESCLRVPGFEHEQLTRKLANNPNAIGRTASIDQMLDQFEEVYNYRQQIKMPLAFEARERRKH